MSSRDGREAAHYDKHAEVHAIDALTNSLFDCGAIVGTLRDGLAESIEGDDDVPYCSTDLGGILGVLKDRLIEAEKALRVLDVLRIERRDGGLQKTRAT